MNYKLVTNNLPVFYRSSQILNHIMGHPRNGKSTVDKNRFNFCFEVGWKFL